MTTFQQKKEKVAALLLKAKNSRGMADLLSDLFTPQEIETLAERISIFESLLQSEPQRSIAEKLQCSIATVTRGSRELQYGTGAIRKLYS